MKLAQKVVDLLRKNNMTVAVMESCTGGGVAHYLTNIHKASEVFKEGIVAYATETKIKYGVNPETINKYSVYSIEVAQEMARAIKKNTGADVGIGITGSVSTMDPFNNNSVPGEVFIAMVLNEKKIIKKIIVEVGNKERAKKKVIEEVIHMMLETI